MSDVQLFANMMISFIVLSTVVNIIIGGEVQANDVFQSIFYGGQYDQNDHVSRERREVENQNPFTSKSLYSCRLPMFPENGMWNISNAVGKPGDFVPTATILKFKCLPGYNLTSSGDVFCDNKWSGPFPLCLKFCPPVYTTAHTILTCNDKGYHISCDRAKDGTELTYQCVNEFFETKTKKKMLICVDGQWDTPLPECQPVCGKKNGNAIAVKPGFTETKMYEYPWVVAVYQKISSKFVYGCGGTIISPSIVLTAAHCVSRHFGKNYHVSDFQITAGKYYLNYQDEREYKVQYRNVSSIIKHERYDDSLYSNDIAILIIEKIFNLSEEVQPACVGDIPEPILGSQGETATWGMTEDGKITDHLRTLLVPYANQQTCVSKLPEEFAARYYNPQMICGGFLFPDENLVCKGHSGSGLVFQNLNDKRFYVHGIISLAPNPTQSGQCRAQENILFTKVPTHYAWVEKQIYTFDRCRLPAYPKNGKWELDSGYQSSPRYIVSSGTTLVFSCDDGYVLSTDESKFSCASWHHHPSCKKKCIPLNFEPGSSVECVKEAGDEIKCSDAVEGAIMSYRCPIEQKKFESGSLRCDHDGSWYDHQPVCLTPATAE